MMMANEIDSDERADLAEEILDSQAWMRMINRGGLTKCKNDFYVYMREVEMACKGKQRKNKYLRL